MKNWLNYIVLFCAITSFEAKSQINCIQSDIRTGCTPFEVKISYCGPLLDNGLQPPNIYNYNGTTFTSSKTFTYTQEGVYSITQRIASDPGKPTQDSTFKNFFKVVSTPDFKTSILPCKDKGIAITIDSTSYDFYVITNSINLDQDTIFESGTLIKNFNTSSSNTVDFTITGAYLGAECKKTNTFQSELIENIIPISIDYVSEYERIEIKLKSIPKINYKLALTENNTIIKTNSVTNPDLINMSTLNINYDKILFTANDNCLNIDTIFNIPTFKSSTNFENNQNSVLHISPTFVPKEFIYTKLNTDTTIIPSSIDIKITCGSKDCYFIQSKEIIKNYTFNRISTGNCGKSFSIDKPSFKYIEIDNSNPSFSLLQIDTLTVLTSVTIKNIEYMPYEANNFKLPFTTNCIEITLKNSCDQVSSLTKICPLVLSKNGFSLSWNATPTKFYDLYTISQNGDTSLITANLTSNYILDSKQFKAQSFCVFILEKNSLIKSNSVCYEDFPYVFIPELAYKSDPILKIKLKYINSFDLKLYDFNGNLINQWDENSIISLEKLDMGTYFYIFNGTSEDGDAITDKGSIKINN